MSGGRGGCLSFLDETASGERHGMGRLSYGTFHPNVDGRYWADAGSRIVDMS